MSVENRLYEVIKSIDEINLQDEREEIVDGKNLPREYLYALRSDEILKQYWPDSNELVKIAVHGHHVKRWAIPRSEFPMDRKGYLKWRTALKLMHADLLSNIMQTYDYSHDEIDALKRIVLRSNLKSNPDTQRLEDVICLVFLKYYFEDFSSKHSEEKIISIIQKTWNKMSDQAHEYALQIDYSSDSKAMLLRALE